MGPSAPARSRGVEGLPAIGAWRLLAGVALAGGCLAACSGAAATPSASGCIAPANPGGGWDLTCRMTADALSRRDSAAPALRVTNVPGNGGGVAFATVVRTMHGDGDVIVAASPSTLLGLVQRHYGALTMHDVRWVAAIATEPSVIAVRASAPWRDLSELIAAWRANPERITVAGASSFGGQDHMKALVLARAVGVDVRAVRYVPYSGPLAAMDAVEADTAQVFPGDASEVRRAVEEHRLRVLAVLAEQRAEGVLASVPTAGEQGVPVTWTVWRGFYAPPGITDEAYARWVDRLTRMATTPGWTATLAHEGLSPFLLTGSAFEEFIRQEADADLALSRQIGLVP